MTLATTKSTTTGGRSPRRNADIRMSVAMPTKGLLNAPGENNCFLNSGVQVLWHLDVFRRSFRFFEGHACLGESCIFCALKEIFQKFQESDEEALAPKILRVALAKSFQDQHRFQLGRMDDAAECFENILSRLHFHMAFPEPEDTCDARHCITHRKFAMQVLEQVSCRCGATSEPMPFFQTVHYVSSAAMVDRADDLRADASLSSFGLLLKKTSLHGEIRLCPDEKRCTFKHRRTSQTKVHRTLMNAPDVACLGINWNTDQPDADYISAVMDCIGQRLCLSELFDNVATEDIRATRLSLVGVVAYYGKHYTTFLYNTREETWWYFDDARVIEIGSRWEHVKKKCQHDHFQPLLIIYANLNGHPVDSSSGPKRVTHVTENEIKAAQHYQQPEKRRKSLTISRSVSMKNNVPIIAIAESANEGTEMHRSKTDEDISNAEQSHSYNRLGKKSKSFSKLLGSRLKGFKKLPSPPSKRTIKSIGQPMPVAVDHTAREPPLVNGVNGDRRVVENDQSWDSPRRRTPERQKGKSRSTQEIVVDLSDCNLSDYDNTDCGYVSRSNSGESEAATLLESSQTNSHENLIDLSPPPVTVVPNDWQVQYEEMVNEAEECLSRSTQAEQLGDTIRALRLCTHANTCYRNAAKLPDLSASLMHYANTKRYESMNRSRLLCHRIEGTGASSEGYASSDYDSMSESSGSPVMPYNKDLSTPVIEHLLTSQRLRDQETKFNTKSSSPPPTSNTHVDRPRQPVIDDNLSYSIQHVMKQSPHKGGPPAESLQRRNTERRPSLSEMEALDNLMQEFDSHGVAVSGQNGNRNRLIWPNKTTENRPIIQWVNDNREDPSCRHHAVSDSTAYRSAGPPPPPSYDEVIQRKQIRDTTINNSRWNGRSESIGQLVQTHFTELQRGGGSLSDVRQQQHCEQCGRPVEGRRLFCNRCRSDYV